MKTKGNIHYQLAVVAQEIVFKLAFASRTRYRVDNA